MTRQNLQLITIILTSYCQIREPLQSARAWSNQIPHTLVVVNKKMRPSSTCPTDTNSDNMNILPSVRFEIISLEVLFTIQRNGPGLMNSDSVFFLISVSAFSLIFTQMCPWTQIKVTLFPIPRRQSRVCIESTRLKLRTLRIDWLPKKLFRFVWKCKII